MDGRRFDALTRLLGHAIASRRGLLQGGVATTLAGLAGVLRPVPIKAVEHDSRCPEFVAVRNNRVCNGGQCAADCGGITGVCTLTAAGTRDCVRNIFNSDCPTTDECDQDSDCGTGQVCVRLGGCCCTVGSHRNRRRCKRRNKCLDACA